MDKYHQTKAMNQGILGYGEVGKAVEALIKPKYPVLLKDLKLDTIKDNPIDVLHVCIPFSDKFVDIICKIATQLNPDLIVIHSTVAPGTTELIHQKSGIDIVHTPFNGVHPQKPEGQFIHGEGYQLKDYFKLFPKIIGPTTKSSGLKAKKLFESVGLKVEIFDTALEAELSKILCTTYYGWNILFEKWVNQVCKDKGANFDQVYTQYNHWYNQGYQPVMPYVQRPVLKHHQGKIGGHCVISNAEILQEYLKDAFTKFLLDQNSQL